MSHQYELVLFGATGYTGKLTAEHIATHCPTDLKWAISGRNSKKLYELAERLRKLNADRIQPEIEIAELNDANLDALAKKTRLMISTVGPYAKYGEHALKACAENGTHYLDCTGEAPWLKTMIDKYDQRAKNSKAIIIPQAGVDSVPADIVAYILAHHIRTAHSADTAEVTNALVKMKAKPSGGTLSTLLSQHDIYPLKHIVESIKPYALSPVQPDLTMRRSSSKPSLFTRLLGVRHDQDLGILTTSLQGRADTTIVNRSWGLFSSRGPEAAYGPNFDYGEYMRAGSTLSGILIHLGISLGGLALLLPPVRWLVKKLVFQPGEGPTPEEYAHDEAAWRGIAFADTPQRQKAAAEFEFKNSLYVLTGLCLAEAAMVILRGNGSTEAEKIGGGLLTPAMLGEQYVDRLRKAGVRIDVKTVE